MRKNKIFLLCFVLLTAVLTPTAFAQERKMNVADFEKRKMEYIKKEAGLTDEEAQKFFPIFNELTQKKFSLHKGHRDIIEKIKNEKSSITDEEYKRMLENDTDVKLKEAELDKAYSSKLEEVLSPEKLYKAQQAERRFIQLELLKYREKK